MKLQDLKDLCLIDRDPLVLEDTGMEGMFIVGADGDVIETVYAKRDSFQHNTILLMIHRNNKFSGLMKVLNEYLDDTMAVEGDDICVVCGNTLEYSDNGDVQQCNDVDCLRVMILNAVLDAEEVEGI